MKAILIAFVATTALASPSLAADLAARPYTKAPALPPALNWSGFYLGATIGGGVQSNPSSYGSEPGFFALNTLNVALASGAMASSQSGRGSGALGGVTLGYNWQSGLAVYGVEGDWSWTGLKSSTSITPPQTGFFPLVTTTTDTKTEWLATVRGRIGYLATPATLLFASGGLAIGQIAASSSVVPSSLGSSCANNAFCSFGSANTTRVGWSAGGGVEHALGTNWTVKVEYLHYDLGSVSYSTLEAATDPAFVLVRGQPQTTVRTKVNGDIGRIGVNYRF